MDIEFIVMEDLIAELKGRLASFGMVISVDGVAGAGQKAIADKLAAQFSCEIIEVDNTSDAAKLKTEIASKQKKGTVIISGILMRKLMADAGIKPDIGIYVVPSEKNNRRTFWEGILSKPLPVYLAELKTDLDKKTVEYHWKFHPIINADYLVEGY
ncbi:MAG: hypothetical protein WC547_08340 [Candidatus Omnitrophota bacterium]